MKKYKDIIAGSVLLAFSIAYLCLSFPIKLTYIDRVVGSRKFPQIVACVLIFCSVYILIKGILDLKKTQKEEANRPKTVFESGVEAEEGAVESSKKGSMRSFLVLLSFAGFCFFLDKIGFLPTSFLYLLSQMILMANDKLTKKKFLLYLILSIVLSVGIYFMFNNGFKLLLPKASWF